MGWDANDHDSFFDEPEGFDERLVGAGTPTSAGLQSAPVHWLFFGLGLAIVGTLIGLRFGSPWLNLVGWFVGGIGAILMFAVFTLRELKQRSVGMVKATSLPVVLRPALLVAALIAVSVNAWYFADAVSRGRL